MMFEVLHRSLVRLRRSPRREGSKIFSFPAFSVLLARVETIFSAAQFPNHDFEHLKASCFFYAALRVRLAFIAAACRDAGPRFRAADLACFESADFDATECPSFVRA
jgi:hypothetical protein